MCKGNRLCPLKMCITGHYCFRVLFSHIAECVRKFQHQCLYFRNLISEIQTDIKCNLVIS